MKGHSGRIAHPGVRSGVRADVIDNSHDNVTYNNGQSLVAHGNNITQTINVSAEPLDTLISNMPRSKHAEFDMVKGVQRGACAPDTRTAILRDLVAWWRDADAAPVYWMSGIPGTGKTTIVFTFCQYLKKRRVLGASFFCSRSLADCQDVHLIFPTIAFQLARNLPSYARSLMKVLRKDPDIHNRSPGDQLQKLIIEPFRKNGDKLPTDLVVAVDALDECNEKHSQFLNALLKYGDRLPFKLVLTSRPEHVINKSMSTENATSYATIFILHEVEKSSVQEDITKYLQHELASLSPPPSTTHLLADRSGGLFIYAATLARFILQENGDSAGRLKFLLAALSQNKNVGSITQALDALYRSILSRVFDLDTASSEEVENLRNVLYTVVYAREPLTRQAIAVLWGLEEFTVDNRLALLHSVISVPRDPTCPISTFHASFPDFIMDKVRSGRFHCNAETFNGILALMCFRIMNMSLRQNICQLGGRSPNTSIKSRTIRSHVSQTLSYACLHGISHLKSCFWPIPQNLKAETLDFILNHALHWLECLSLLGRLAASTVSLDTLMTVLAKNPGITALCHEIYKFAQANYTLISHSCLEIYHSALVWVPSQSYLRTSYAALWAQPGLPVVLRGLPTAWTNLEHILHHDNNSSYGPHVAISSDGNRIISGSSGGSVCAWDINSHSLEFTLYAPSVSNNFHHVGLKENVNDDWSPIAITTSLHGAWILSSNRRKALHVWNTASQSKGFVLEDSRVMCAAISPDGKLVCSNFGIWELATGRQIQALRTDTGTIKCVAFTLDSKYIVSGSENTTQVWEVESGKTIRVFREHWWRTTGSKCCIAISSSNSHIITGSSSRGVIVVWTLQGDAIHLLRGHQKSVNSVAFFHDGRRAASGSDDYTIRIWDIIAGTTLAAWEGHNAGSLSMAVSPRILSIAVSPDSLRIVSGSSDRNVAIWTVPESAVPSEASSHRLWKHLKWPWKRRKGGKDGRLAKGIVSATALRTLCIFQTGSIFLLDSETLEERAAFRTEQSDNIALSSQGNYLASYALGESIYLWNVTTGKKRLLEGFGVQSMTFSQDEQHLISISKICTAYIWVTKTGQQQYMFNHPGGVPSVAISYDGTRIVSASDAGTRVWDMETGQQQQHLQSGRVAKVAFSKEDRHVITHDYNSRPGTIHEGTISLWDLATGRLMQSQNYHISLATLFDSATYAYHKSGWLHRFVSPMQSPDVICWIPSQYRPKSLAAEYVLLTAFSSSEWDFVDLSRRSPESIVLRIPRSTLTP